MATSGIAFRAAFLVLWPNVMPYLNLWAAQNRIGDLETEINASRTSFTWNVACVIGYKPWVSGINLWHQAWTRTWTMHNNWFNFHHSAALLIICMLFQSITCDDWVSLSHVLARLRNKSCVARHEVFLWVILWQVVGRDGVLGSLRWEIRYKSRRLWFQGQRLPDKSAF